MESQTLISKIETPAVQIRRTKLMEQIAGWHGNPTYEALKELSILKFGGVTYDYGYETPNDQIARDLLSGLSGAMPFGGFGCLRIIHKVLLANILFKYIYTEVFDGKTYQAVLRCDRDYYSNGSLYRKLLPAPKA